MRTSHYVIRSNHYSDKNDGVFASWCTRAGCRASSRVRRWPARWNPLLANLFNEHNKNLSLLQDVPNKKLLKGKQLHWTTTSYEVCCSSLLLGWVSTVEQQCQAECQESVSVVGRESIPPVLALQVHQQSGRNLVCESNAGLSGTGSTRRWYRYMVLDRSESMYGNHVWCLIWQIQTFCYGLSLLLLRTICSFVIPYIFCITSFQSLSGVAWS